MEDKVNMIYQIVMENTRDIKTLLVDVSAIQARAALWGFIAGLIPTAIATIYYITKIKGGN